VQSRFSPGTTIALSPGVSNPGREKMAMLECA